MPKNIQLLKQLRNTAATINQTAGNPEHKTLLTSMDFVLNELLLQDSSLFYLNYIAEGKALLREGRTIANQPHLADQFRDDLHADFRIDIFNAEIVKLHAALQETVAMLDESRAPAEKSFLVRLTDWETALYNHRLEQVHPPLPEQQSKITLSTLQTYLRQKFPERQNLTVTKFAVLDGGFSKKTILFETEDALYGNQALVMRAEQTFNLLGYDGSDVTKEFYTIQLMHKSGLPIAEPLWLEADPTYLGTRFIVSRRAIGRTYGGNFGSDERLSPAILDSLLATFMAMHGVNIDPTDPLAQKSHLNEWLPYRTVTDAAKFCVKVFLPRLIKLTEIPASPQLARALHWLEHNVPEVDEPPSMVHMDFNFNNLIFDGHKISAVLDWESSYLGDPALDIVWTQFGIQDYVSMPEFLSRYKAGTGRAMSDYRIAYARVLKCAFNAISCLSAAHAFDKSDAAPINLSILGFKYMALFGVQFNALIADAEKIKDQAHGR
jgi:aminoglycoside phosphotransferase (APT) family kinase protein